MKKNNFTEEMRVKIIADWVLGINRVVVWCEVYGDKIANSLHHLFPQNKVNKKLYPDFIHHPKHLLMVHLGNHLNRPMPSLTELEFCKIMGIEPRSKSLRSIT